MTPVPWNHLALVYNGTEQILFFNGKLLQQQPATKPGPLKRDRELLIGGYQSGDGIDSSTGLLRSVKISRTAVYSTDFTPVPRLQVDDDTVLLYDFQQDSQWMTSPLGRDQSNNEITGELQGAWWNDVHNQ